MTAAKKPTPRKRAPRKATPKANVYQDTHGNWIGVRTFTYASGAQGVERVVLMKRTQDCFADEQNRAEAERRAEEWSKTWK